MSWNYRVVKKKYVYQNSDVRPAEYHYGIYEVYYDKKGNPTSVSVDPQAPIGERKTELVVILDEFRSALDKPVLDFENIGRSNG